jgi:hypothetical protein
MSFRLLVEGADDKHLLKNVLRSHAIDLNEKTEIVDCEGIANLLHASLRAHLLGSYDAVAIVVDADLDVIARWQSIRARLVDLGYDPPAEPSPGGLILTTRMPAVGVWLMPNNIVPGTLEALHAN